MNSPPGRNLWTVRQGEADRPPEPSIGDDELLPVVNSLRTTVVDQPREGERADEPGYMLRLNI